MVLLSYFIDAHPVDIYFCKDDIGELVRQFLEDAFHDRRSAILSCTEIGETLRIWTTTPNWLLTSFNFLVSTARDVLFFFFSIIYCLVHGVVTRFNSKCTCSRYAHARQSQGDNLWHALDSCGTIYYFARIFFTSMIYEHGFELS